MLICPQCQFENPNTNKFCQRCGTSLIHKVCPECATNVPLSAERCQNCGAATGTVWQAIILRQLEQGIRDLGLGTWEEKTIISGVEASKETIGNQTLEISTSSPPPLFSKANPELLQPLASASLSLPAGAYLDQQRYQLLEPLPSSQEIGATSEVLVRVLDCQPFQLSPLEANADSVVASKIPAIAKIYLTLQSQFYEAIPAIHDAWQQDGMQVVLIADRSHWLELITLWHDDKTTPLQLLHWLYEITQLWGVLEPYKCRQSLLELDNLRVDEDGMLGLQRLEAETDTGKPLTLPDLGQVWRKLFQESQRTQFGSLVDLLDALENGNIQTIDELRSLIEAIAGELQANIPATPDLDTTIQVVASADEAQDSLTKGDDMPTLVLPMQLVNLEDAGRTDVGRQRNHNEDFFGIETAINKLQFPNNSVIQARGVYILCDGMGGHAGGEVASNLAVKTLQQYFQTHWHDLFLPTEDVIREAVLLANQAIYDMNQQDARSGVGRMGTTLVMVLLQNTQVAVAHVGDSRLYRFSRMQSLEQVTLDHEVGQREILRGIEPEIAYGRPDAYQLTQALGPREQNFINPEVQFLDLTEDTLLLLTSDGLSDNDLLEQHWQTHLEPLLSSGASLERGVSDLIDLANQYNGHDNITAVAIRVKVRPNQQQVKS